MPTSALLSATATATTTAGAMPASASHNATNANNMPTNILPAKPTSALLIIISTATCLALVCTVGIGCQWLAHGLALVGTGWHWFGTGLALVGIEWHWLLLLALVIAIWLLVIGYWLLVIGYWLYMPLSTATAAATTTAGECQPVPATKPNQCQPMPPMPTTAAKYQPIYCQPSQTVQC